MPKLVGVRERRHQPYYDTLIRASIDTAPTPTVAAETHLFNGTNLGLEFWTNMNIAGSFASDNTYVVLALRVWLWFIDATGRQTPKALLMYQLAVHQMYLQLIVGDKPQFAAQAWYFPSGGGIWGNDSSTPALVNGMPSQQAILKLAKPIAIPARQHFSVKVNLHDTGTTSLRTTYLNASADIGKREIKVMLDGIHTRDVL